MAADQEATKLTDSLKANTDTKILLPIKDQKQFNSIADSMQLNKIQKQFIQDLSVGQAVVQHGGNKPVPVDLHYYDAEKTVDDQELEQHQREKWDELEYTRRQEVELNFNEDSGNQEYGDSSLTKYL